MDYLNIGSTPHDEPCKPIEHAFQYTEAVWFAEQIERAYPPPPSARIKVKAFDHDFGTYYEACIIYRDTDEEAIEYAYMVEADSDGKLQKWDSRALEAIEAIEAYRQ